MWQKLSSNSSLTFTIWNLLSIKMCLAKTSSCFCLQVWRGFPTIFLCNKLSSISGPVLRVFPAANHSSSFSLSLYCRYVFKAFCLCPLGSLIFPTCFYATWSAVILSRVIWVVDALLYTPHVCCLWSVHSSSLGTEVPGGALHIPDGRKLVVWLSMCKLFLLCNMCSVNPIECFELFGHKTIP